MLERYFRENTDVHLYALADLDEPFWDDTRWIVAQEEGKVTAVLLLLANLKTPIVYGICEPGDNAMRQLLKAYASELPEVFFAHFGNGVLDVLGQYRFDCEGDFFKMVLEKPSLDSPSEAKVELESDFQILREFYSERAYGDDNEERSFAPYMLDFSPHHVIWQNGRIVSAAGVHAASKKQSVAAIGNIATEPLHRGRGYASATTRSLVRNLVGTYKNIGLNVKADNAAAIRCYEKLGFRRRLSYVEGMMVKA